MFACCAIGAAVAVQGASAPMPATTPEEIIGQATLYMKIYFIGFPSMMIYNFSSAVMRSVGDTRHPLMFLVIGGAVNIVLNLFFVLVLKMDVAGVATATAISQTMS